MINFLKSMFEPTTIDKIEGNQEYFQRCNDTSDLRYAIKQSLRVPGIYIDI